MPKVYEYRNLEAIGEVLRALIRQEKCAFFDMAELKTDPEALKATVGINQK